ncbi:rare lipoprotein A [Thermaerobacter marianensis DSM 12885]|uniref:Probable endolytic peptidoglycan transglycosylase RlpA n=1 Tax=Thermaerobacter marianensis (strain ATCC 700841 / DSM 12885 / JCM 10246 / 7p75a) TaxID=644966 RepID=E6SLF1_THEM7|nr:septal ring lytic transglycosylase RlpA family protein [Thermaerobacter marianensis]ADU52393.1 rare lipoprotein A [Thermaerobacter marianensis DSM 12885]
MRTARALGRAARAALFLLAMGAAAGGAWPAAGAPPRPSPQGPVVAATAGGPWASSWTQQVQRLGDFAAFLATDTRSQWQEAAGDLARWSRQALPRLEEALAAARDVVAASAEASAPVWRQLRDRLGGWWPPDLPGADLPGTAWPPADPSALGSPAAVAGDAAGFADAAADEPGRPAVEPGPPAGAAPGMGRGTARPPASGIAGGGGDVAVPALVAGAATAPGEPSRLRQAAPGPVPAAAQDAAKPLSPAAAGAERDGPSSAGGGDAAPGHGGEAAGDAARSSQDGHRARDTNGELDETPAPAGGEQVPAPAAGEEADGRWIPAVASWYGPGFYGRPTASGEIFTGREMTAAHRTMPFGTVLLVTYPETGRSVQVRINDRGPFVEGRDLDLSEAAAEALGMVSAGVVRVFYRVLRWGG